MPKNPESEGSRLITLKQIELEHGVSRSALHTYRRSASFPQPVPVEGSTKTQYRADEVAAWFAANPKQQGKKRDQFVSHQQGESVTTTVDPRTAILSDLCHPEWNPVSESHGMSHDDAVKLVDAYRAAVLREAAKRLDKTHDYPSGDATATGAYLSGMEKAATLLRRMADEAEASDG